MKPKNKYNLTCVYTGRRLMQNGKVWQRFEMPDGKERFFSGIKRVWIGYTYLCGAKEMSARPERVDVERVDNPEWEAQDAIVDEQNAKKRAEAKFKNTSTPAIKAALTALEPLVTGVGMFEVDALVRVLARKAWDNARRKEKGKTK